MKKIRIAEGKVFSMTVPDTAFIRQNYPHLIGTTYTKATIEKRKDRLTVIFRNSHGDEDFSAPAAVTDIIYADENGYFMYE